MPAELAGLLQGMTTKQMSAWIFAVEPEADFDADDGWAEGDSEMSTRQFYINHILKNAGLYEADLAAGSHPLEAAAGTAERAAPKGCPLGGYPDGRPAKTTTLLSKNSKMSKSSLRTWNFGLPAYRAQDGTIVCPGAGQCGLAAGCFAMNGKYGMPEVTNAFEWHLQMTKNPERFKAMIAEEIASHPTLQAVRIHDSGDFYSRAYLDTWIEIARAHPDKHFYAYTKSVKIVKDAQAEGKMPDNLRITFSEGGKMDALIDPEKDRHARLFATRKELEAAGYTYASYDDAVAAVGESNKIGLVFFGDSAARKAWGVRPLTKEEKAAEKAEKARVKEAFKAILEERRKLAAERKAVKSEWADAPADGRAALRQRLTALDDWSHRLDDQEMVIVKDINEPLAVKEETARVENEKAERARQADAEMEDLMHQPVKANLRASEGDAGLRGSRFRFVYRDGSPVIPGDRVKFVHIAGHPANTRSGEGVVSDDQPYLNYGQVRVIPDAPVESVNRYGDVVSLDTIEIGFQWKNKKDDDGTLVMEMSTNREWGPAPGMEKLTAGLRAAAPYTAPAEPAGTPYRNANKFFEREGLYNGRGYGRRQKVTDLTKKGAHPMKVRAPQAVTACRINGRLRVIAANEALVSFRVYTNTRDGQPAVQLQVKPAAMAAGLESALKQAGFERVQDGIYDRPGQDLREAKEAVRGALAVANARVEEESSQAMVVSFEAVPAMAPAGLRHADRPRVRAKATPEARAAVSRKMEKMSGEDKPEKQKVAIAMETARRKGYRSIKPNPNKVRAAVSDNAAVNRVVEALEEVVSDVRHDETGEGAEFFTGSLANGVVFQLWLEPEGYLRQGVDFYDPEDEEGMAPPFETLALPDADLPDQLKALTEGLAEMGSRQPEPMEAGLRAADTWEGPAEAQKTAEKPAEKTDAEQVADMPIRNIKVTIHKDNRAAAEAITDWLEKNQNKAFDTQPDGNNLVGFVPFLLPAEGSVANAEENDFVALLNTLGDKVKWGYEEPKDAVQARRLYRMALRARRLTAIRARRLALRAGTDELGGLIEKRQLDALAKVNPEVMHEVDESAEDEDTGEPLYTLTIPARKELEQTLETFKALDYDQNLQEAADGWAANIREEILTWLPDGWQVEVSGHVLPRSYTPLATGLGFTVVFKGPNGENLSEDFEPSAAYYDDSNFSLSDAMKSWTWALWLGSDDSPFQDQEFLDAYERNEVLGWFSDVVIDDFGTEPEFRDLLEPGVQGALVQATRVWKHAMATPPQDFDGRVTLTLVGRQGVGETLVFEETPRGVTVRLSATTKTLRLTAKHTPKDIVAWATQKETK